MPEKLSFASLPVPVFNRLLGPAREKVRHEPNAGCLAAENGRLDAKALERGRLIVAPAPIASTKARLTIACSQPQSQQQFAGFEGCYGRRKEPCEGR
jgi:hypothetical protein